MDNHYLCKQFDLPIKGDRIFLNNKFVLNGDIIK